MEGTDRQQGGPVGGAVQDLWIESGQFSEIRCNYPKHVVITAPLP